MMAEKYYLWQGKGAMRWTLSFVFAVLAEVLYFYLRSRGVLSDFSWPALFPPVMIALPLVWGGNSFYGKIKSLEMKGRPDAIENLSFKMSNFVLAAQTAILILVAVH